MNEGRKPSTARADFDRALGLSLTERSARPPRWEQRGDGAAQSVRNHLIKMIPKLDVRDPDTLRMREPFTEDECRLLTEILAMLWRGEDARTLLYKPSTGKSRPIEAERDQKIAEVYVAGLLNQKKPKEIRGEIAKKHRITDDHVRKILLREKNRIGSLRALHSI